VSLQYAAGGPILSVSGGLHYSTPRPIERDRGALATRAGRGVSIDASAYWRARAAFERPRELEVRGVAVPYDTAVDCGPTLGRCLFTAATVWDVPEAGVPLKGNHSSLLGRVQVTEERAGLTVAGWVDGPMRRLADGKRWLSPAFEILAERTAGGVREVTAARLDEVSLVDRAQLQPYTYATLREVARAL
jgi:hypothetical protein